MEFSAKTVEEAVELGLKEVGIEKDQAEITVVKEAVKGLFGRVKENAVVEVSKKLSGNEKTIEFLQKLFELMDVNAKAVLVSDLDNTVIDVITDDSSKLIGKRGESLDAIQALASAYANTFNKDYKKVVVNCENYRERREETLVKLAHKLEEKATEMRREVQLEPMNPFERRIIHTALAESETVTTRSDGKDPNRYVVIVPNDKDEFSKPYNAGKNERQNKKGGFDKKRSNFKGGKGQGRSSSSKDRKKSTIVFGTYLGNSLKDKN